MELERHRQLNRRVVLAAAAGAGMTLVAPWSLRRAGAQELPPLPQKDSYRVGFAQVSSNNPWRLAQTKSLQDEAAARGWELIMTDANEDTAKQIADLDSIMAQRPDVILLPPRESQPLANSVLKAKQLGIPVILIDRDVDHAIAKPGVDYVTFVGSDFVDQGRRAAEWLIEATGGEAKIIELEGTTGADPAIDRRTGFDDLILKGEFKGEKVIDPPAGMEIIASQTGDFVRDKGRQVMETLLQAHPDVTAVYAHSDEMALGAIAALEAAGRTPGEDVLVVGIDGQNSALDAIVEGNMGASVESSPFFGPIAFDTIEAYANGEDLPDWIQVEDRFFDASNAEEFQGKQF